MQLIKIEQIMKKTFEKQKAIMLLVSFLLLLSSSGITTASEIPWKIWLFVLCQMPFQTQPGLKPATLWLQDRHTDHQATTA